MEIGLDRGEPDYGTCTRTSVDHMREHSSLWRFLIPEVGVEQHIRASSTTDIWAVSSLGLLCITLF